MTKSMICFFSLSFFVDGRLDGDSSLAAAGAAAARGVSSGGGVSGSSVNGDAEWSFSTQNYLHRWNNIQAREDFAFPGVCF